MLYFKSIIHFMVFYNSKAKIKITFQEKSHLKNKSLISGEREGEGGRERERERERELIHA